MYEDASLEAFVMNRIKELFASGGITVYRFSMLTGIPRSTIDDYIKGRVCPSIRFVEVYCSFIGITQEEFYKPYDKIFAHHLKKNMQDTSIKDSQLLQMRN